MKQIMIKREIFRPTRNLLIMLVLLVSVNNIQAQAVWDNTSFVHRNGQEIHNGQNNVINLDGVNIGSWLMWEGLMWGGGLISEKDITNKMTSVIGPVAFENFRDSVYKNYITRADIKRISDECYNVVRIPFNHNLLEDDANPYVYKPEGWAILDSVLKWCEDYNVYVVLDMHAAPGGQANWFIADPDSIDFWNSPVNKNRTIQLWKAIADRYSNRGIIAAYDLLNEPNIWWWPDLVNLYNNIITEIRTVDSNHMIMLEGNNYAQDFSMFTSLPDSNICFQFHYYTFFFSAPNIPAWTALSNTLNVPIWCGEWGEDTLGGMQNKLTNIIRNPANKISGQAFWTWKTVTVSGENPHCLNVNNHPDWSNTMLWATYNSPTVTALEMQNGIDNFIINMKLQNCLVDTGVFNMLNLCSVTGIQNIEALKHLNVYPNPFTSSINIEGIVENEYYELLNSTGQIIWTGKQINNQDFSSLTNGLYFLRIYNGNSTQTTKLIKD
jgi:aryl-phospho-beta-D-glucosidase BglC (GH1 family)